MAASTSTSSSSSSDTEEELKDISSMRIGEIKQELESYGISTKSFLEKSELVEAVAKARADGLKPKPKASTTTKSSTRTNTESNSASSSTSSSSSSSSSTDSRPREERLKEEVKKCQTMKNSELKQELTERGISTASFFEKAEFVNALAEARVDNITKKSAAGSSNEEAYAEYADVEVLTSDDAGPRPKGGQQQQQAQSPFGGVASGASPFGDMMGGMGGMGGMGNIADLLKNMGGAAGGSSPFAGGAGAAGKSS